MPASRLRLLLAWTFALVTVVLCVVEQRHVGIARDEVVYMGAGTKYADWWLGGITLDREGITKSWGGKGATDNNREHPPLMKTLFGLSEKLAHDKLGITGELVGYRFPNALAAGLLVALVFLMTSAIWGLSAAVIASLLTLCLPRALFHAGLACFDAPMVTMWFAVVYAYWGALKRRWVTPVVGVALGLAFLTKHNAILIPFALVPHLAFVTWRSKRWRQLLGIPVVALVAFVVFVALWPWMWFDTFTHIKEWMAFHFTHVHYNFEYLGQNWNAPRFPWHVALVTTLFTVPTVTLGAAAFGVVAWIRDRATNPDRERAPALLLFLSAGVAMGPFLLGTTPIFGAEKHWAPAIPPICIAAGVGVTWVASLVRWPRVATAVVGTLVIAAAAVETVVAQPDALTSYTALAGGAPGGADLGMNRQFWGTAARSALPIIPTLVADPKQRTPVYSHDASMAWGTYLRLDMLPKTFPDSGQEQYGIDASKLALVVHELHFNRHDYMIWKTYGTVQPAAVVRKDGVPIVSIYRRR